MQHVIKKYRINNALNKNESDLSCRSQGGNTSAKVRKLYTRHNAPCKFGRKLYDNR
jgi:hypothetical protein